MLTQSHKPPRGNAGFTLVELVVALVILAVALLGLSASTTGLVRSVSEEEIKATLLQAVEDRISEVRMDPRYGGLETLYENEESDVLGLDGYTRSTAVERVEASVAGGGVRDYTVVVVTVKGPGLEEPLSRRVVVAAP